MLMKQKVIKFDGIDFKVLNYILIKAYDKMLQKYWRKVLQPERHCRTQSDNEVLAYVAGFIVRDLKSLYTGKRDEEKTNLIKMLTCDQSEGAHRQMTQMKDRGALVYVTDKFFALVSKLERTFHEKYDNVQQNILLEDFVRQCSDENYDLFVSCVECKGTDDDRKTVLADIATKFFHARIHRRSEFYAQSIKTKGQKGIRKALN